MRLTTQRPQSPAPTLARDTRYRAVPSEPSSPPPVSRRLPDPSQPTATQPDRLELRGAIKNAPPTYLPVVARRASVSSHQPDGRSCRGRYAFGRACATRYATPRTMPPQKNNAHHWPPKKFMVLLHQRESTRSGPRRAGGEIAATNFNRVFTHVSISPSICASTKNLIIRCQMPGRRKVGYDHALWSAKCPTRGPYCRL